MRRIYELEGILTEQEMQFCRAYLLNWNRPEAAKAAGYEKPLAAANELLKREEIREYIELLKENIEEITGVSKMRVIEELSKIAFSNLSRFHDTWIKRKELGELSEEDKACIESIETRVRTSLYGEEEEVKIKLYSKLKALNELKDIMGYKGVAKVDLTSAGEKIQDLSSLSTEELLKRADAVKNLSNQNKKEG